MYSVSLRFPWSGELYFSFIYYTFSVFLNIFCYIGIWFRILYFLKDSGIADIYIQCTMYIELVPFGTEYNDRFFFLGLIALHTQSGYNLINVTKPSSVTSIRMSKPYNSCTNLINYVFATWNSDDSVYNIVLVVKIANSRSCQLWYVHFNIYFLRYNVWILLTWTLFVR